MWSSQYISIIIQQLLLLLTCLRLQVTGSKTPSIRFKCSGGETSPINDSSSTNIYLTADNSPFYINCILVEDQGHASTENVTVGYRGYGWSSLAYTAHRLIFSIYNNTWSRSYVFPPAVDGIWQLQFSLENLTLSVSEVDNYHLTDWLYKAELDTGLFKSYGSIVLLGSQPSLSLPPGLEAKGSLSVEEVQNISSLIGHHHPCSESLWIITPVLDGKIYLGISKYGLSAQWIIWYDITEQIKQTCETLALSTCARPDVKLIDFVFTNHHIFLVTNIGYYVSSKLERRNQSSLLSWSRVNPFEKTTYKDAKTYEAAIVHYSSVCLDVQRQCIMADRIDVTYNLPQNEAIVCSGKNNFTDEFWSCEVEKLMLDDFSATQIVYNGHTGSAVIFHWSDTLLQAAVSIALPALDKLHLPVFYLPMGKTFHKIMLHPFSMNIFVLGEELWMSCDMGATFQVVLKPDKGVITDLVFNGNSMHSEVLAVVDLGNGFTSIAYGMLESRRFRQIRTIEGLVVAHPLVNDEKNIRLLKISQGDIIDDLITMSDIEQVLMDRIYLDIPIAVQFYSDTEIIVYEVLGEKKLMQMHIGVVLSHTAGGQGLITDIHHTDAGISQITLHTTQSFLGAVVNLTNNDNLLYIEYNKESSTSYVTQLSSNNKRPLVNAWSESMVGLTIIIAFHSNYLIISEHNSTTIIAKAISNPETHTVKAEAWKLANFSSGTCWLEEDQCRQLIQVKPAVPQTMIALDLGMSTSFDILASRVLNKERHSMSLLLQYSNPFLFTKHIQRKEEYGFTKIELTLSDRYYKKSASSLMIYYPYSSLRCSPSTVIYTLLLCCPYRKRIVFNYPQYLTQQVRQSKGKLSDPGKLKTLPVNYRPPSSHGIAIPLTYNIYNANPNEPLYKSRYKKSQLTAQFKFPKGCYSTTDSTAASKFCGCPEELRLSQEVKYSDCIQQVYRVSLPGQMYLCFAFEVLNATSGQIYQTAIDKYTLRLHELNNRTDYQIEMETEEKVVKYLQQHVLAVGGVVYNTTPSNIKIKMYNSGLYHFRSFVPEYMSYCDLQTEFIIYVDDPPVAYPIMFMVNFGVSIGMGFIMFVVYACHRLNKKYAQDVKSTHRKPTCYHILPTGVDAAQKQHGAAEEDTTVHRINYDTRGSRVSVGGLLYNRRSLVPGFTQSRD